MRDSKVLKNIIVGFGGQLIVIILGLIIPRVIIINYGSDVNGLFSTVTQIFTYMALLEAGIGQASRNALYKPIICRDIKRVSIVASITQRYFRKITLYYGMGVLILSVLVPYIIKSDVDKISIGFIVLLEGISGVISFYCVETYACILSVDGRGYINNGINVVSRIIGYIVKLIMAMTGMNILIIQLAFLFITFLRVLLFRWYFKKKYAWIDLKCTTKGEVLSDRKYYVITEVAWTVFSSTDIVVISVLISTQMSSVYSIYNLVFGSLNALLNAVYHSVSYILGQSYHEDIKKYEEIHDLYNSFFLGGMTILMSIAYILVIPFVKLYTQGVSDVNYIIEIVPLLFCLIQMLSWTRYVAGNLTAIAGYARRTCTISFVEAMLNIILSVFLGIKFGIVGVLLATVISLPIKVLWCLYIADRRVMHRSYKKTVSIIMINFFIFFMVVIINNKIQLHLKSYGEFIKYGFIITLIILPIGVMLNLFVNFSSVKKFTEVIKK